MGFVIGLLFVLVELSFELGLRNKFKFDIEDVFGLVYQCWKIEGGLLNCFLFFIVIQLMGEGIIQIFIFFKVFFFNWCLDFVNVLEGSIFN